MTMTNEQAMNLIKEMSVQVSSVQVVIDTTCRKLITAIKSSESEVDFHILTPFYNSIGKGINKTLLVKWMVHHLPVKFNRETKEFSRDKKRKWTEVRVPSLQPYYTWEKERKALKPFSLSRKVEGLEKSLEKLVKECIAEDVPEEQREYIKNLLIQAQLVKELI